MQSLKVNYQVMFTRCNLRCEYCYLTPDQKRGIFFDPQTFKAIIDRIVTLPYQIDLRLAVQGEPFLSDIIVDAISKLTREVKGITVHIISNLTMSTQALHSFLKRTRNEALVLTASMHIGQLSDEKSFYRNLELLKKNKVSFVVEMVAFPPLLTRIKKYKEKIENRYHVPVCVDTFHGLLHDRVYPASYSKEERSLLKELHYSKFEYNNMMLLQKSRGKMCSSGRTAIGISNDGNVYRCLADLEFCMGNILRDDICLFKTDQPCRKDFCTCSTRLVRMCEFSSLFEKTKHERVYYPRRGQNSGAKLK